MLWRLGLGHWYPGRPSSHFLPEYSLFAPFLRCVGIYGPDRDSRPTVRINRGVGIRGGRENPG